MLYNIYGATLVSNYNEFFDCIFVTNAYPIFFVKNIEKINILIKKNGYLIVQIGIPYTNFDTLLDNNFMLFRNFYKDVYDDTYTDDISTTKFQVYKKK